MTDWPALIGEMVLIKQAAAEADTEGLWKHRLPAVAATEQQLRAAEHALGFGLDENHRGFLRHANGWPAMYHDVDLFGTEELASGAGEEMLGHLEPEALLEAGVDEADLLPIAASRDDLDLFLLATPSAPSPGAVLWFAGGLIDRFPDFVEFFRAMQDYNRRQVRRSGGADP